jgi:outer membrane protein TolC
LIARRAKVESAQANRSSVELDVAWQEWQVAQAARLAVCSLMSLQEQAALSRQMRDRLADNLALVGKAEQAGLMTELDLSAAQTAGNQAQADWIDLQSQVRQQSLALNKALGLPPETPISLQQGTPSCRLALTFPRSKTSSPDWKNGGWTWWRCARVTKVRRPPSGSQSWSNSRRSI